MLGTFCNAAKSTRLRRNLLGAAVVVLTVGAATGPQAADWPVRTAPLTGLPDVGATALPDYARVDDLLVPDAPDDPGQLNPEQVAQYRRIFALQDRGDWSAADEEIRKLSDKRLLGHVLQHRYLHPDRKASYIELAEWLRLYADHGGAERIHVLAVRRQPAGQKAPRSPRSGDERLNGSLERFAGFRPDMEPPESGLEDAEPDEALLDLQEAAEAVSVTPRSRAKPRSQTDRSAVERVNELLRAGKPAAALGLLGTDEVGAKLDSVQYDTSRSRIAAGMYYSGQVSEALSLASASAARSGSVVTQAHWIAGLSAWRSKQYDRAAKHFEAMVAARPSSAWQASAAAYWAARAHRKKGREEDARAYLAAAALFPHTFYGLVAERALGQTSRLRFTVPHLTREHLAALAERPDGRRGMALIQVGQYEAAERELLRINPRGNPLLEAALIALAERGGLPELALRVGNAVMAPEGAPYDAALFPVPHWRPRDGFAVDRALVFAVMRQESRFDPRLVSSAGATGLMQIMPMTAEHVRERNEDINDASKAALFDPATNLELGQRYMAELLAMPEIGNNLMLMLAAYNAGPGTLQRWRRELSTLDNDPLLFMESLPYAETRGYVEKVMANFWVYRLRLGQETASLDAVAAGRWPVYSSRDARPSQVAQTAPVEAYAYDPLGE
ncbi:transglycosylase SLT domain-containing protein [Azospirillum sp. RWY-5-1]|uniref:Transglycosylase SLT domain-containing protein n=1 Tax=Azospirillum oleiclasticum TaxID=2735135 RepID=A0ABX2TFC1_9PROT|nr:transglycosylase SLT domain-containing protein [Azospirillum oleiclasticum]NYZ15092.1 transglycosylase SLT domain-containing protein [Azospirillum oleiclasticum]NYZ22854.1 transglycosylase SLT domain-containing protein [Azospirillum oleiclasticum]